MLKQTSLCVITQKSYTLDLSFKYFHLEFKENITNKINSKQTTHKLSLSRETFCSLELYVYIGSVMADVEFFVYPREDLRQMMLLVKIDTVIFLKVQD